MIVELRSFWSDLGLCYGVFTGEEIQELARLNRVIQDVLATFPHTTTQLIARTRATNHILAIRQRAIERLGEDGWSLKEDPDGPA